MQSRESFFECTLSSAGAEAARNLVRAWEPSEAEQIFRDQLAVAAVGTRGTIAVRNRSGRVLRKAQYAGR